MSAKIILHPSARDIVKNACTMKKMASAQMRITKSIAMKSAVYGAIANLRKRGKQNVDQKSE